MNRLAFAKNLDHGDDKGVEIEIQVLFKCYDGSIDVKGSKGMEAQGQRR